MSKTPTAKPRKEKPAPAVRAPELEKPQPGAPQPRDKTISPPDQSKRSRFRLS